MNDFFHDLIGEGKVTVYLDDILIFLEEPEGTSRNHQTGSPATMGEQSFPEGREVRVRSARDRVSWSNYLRKLHPNGPCQASWDRRMAYADEEAGTAVVPGLHELLSKIHQKLFEGCKGAHRPYWTLPLEVGLRARQAFVELKQRMAEDVVLTIPNETDPFMVEADASEGAVGAVLSQKQNGHGAQWRSCRSCSPLQNATTRYTTRSC